jgi:hypothetical protein
MLRRRVLRMMVRMRAAPEAEAMREFFFGASGRKAAMLAVLTCATMVAGCGHSVKPDSGGSADAGASGGGSSDSAAEQAAANALKTTPLTEADIDLYLDIMRAAADKITNATGQDRAALDLMKQVNSGKTNGALTPDQAALLARVAQLAQIDEQIAAQRGVQPRYDAIRGVIEGLVGIQACPSCSGDGGTQAASAAQQQEWATEEAVLKTDLAMLQAHSAEITSLQKQVRGILTNPAGSD